LAIDKSRYRITRQPVPEARRARSFSRPTTDLYMERTIDSIRFNSVT
jgi:hypothetical protein